MRYATRRTAECLLLLPSLVRRVKNWPTVLAARVGLLQIDAVRFRDGSNWRLLDVRPGFAVLREVYLERIYDARFHVDPRGAILDLGANVGMFTVLAAKKARTARPCCRGKIVMVSTVKVGRVVEALGASRCSKLTLKGRT